MCYIASTTLLFSLVLALSVNPVSAKNTHDTTRLHRHRTLNSTEGIVHDELMDKRDGDAKFTLFPDGTGACGKFNVPSDFIVAMNNPQWDGGSHCFEMVTLSYNGKSAQAQVVDLCPSCPYRGLDLSAGLFDFFAPESLGVIYGDWSFGTAAAPSPSTPPPPPPPPPPTTSQKHTTSALPPPSSTHIFAPSTTSQPPPATASTSTTITSTLSTDLAYQTGVAGSLETSATDPEALNQVNIAFINMGAVIRAGWIVQS